MSLHQGMNTMLSLGLETIAYGTAELSSVGLVFVLRRCRDLCRDWNRWREWRWQDKVVQNPQSSSRWLTLFRRRT